jgi:FKBP-type peptidyl-prolyl cis-trans isomerase FkpA
MQRWILGVVLALAACKPATPTAGGDAAAPTAAGGALRTDDERTLYALGMVMGQRMMPFNLTGPELAIVQRGIAAQVTGSTPEVNLQEWGPRIDQMARTRGEARAVQERARGTEYANRMAQEEGATRLPSGLIFRQLRAGTGPQPTAEDTVRVHYRGTLMDGTVFDESYNRGEPVEFPLRGVIPCWTEGVARMTVGSKAKLVCPPDIAYGDRPQRTIPAGSTLTFEVELLGITPAAAPAAPAAPGEPAAPPTPPPAAAPH